MGVGTGRQILNFGQVTVFGGFYASQYESFPAILFHHASLDIKSPVSCCSCRPPTTSDFFYITLDTKYVISETILPASLLASTEETKPNTKKANFHLLLLLILPRNLSRLVLFNILC